MERPAKRQRIFTPLNNEFAHRYDQYEDYETQGSELEEDQDDEKEGYAPDDELQQRRAQLDYKLKSTFEAIFEKYGQDFTGIGDEIDLRTGEILVNNGHLMEMQDERDAGISGGAHSRSLSEDDEESMIDSEHEEDMEHGQEEEETEAQGDDHEMEEDDDSVSDEDMMEDDMILRGFAQASQFMHRALSPEVASSLDGYVQSVEKLPQRLPPRPVSVLPSRSEILSQFGPELGPQIVKYVKVQSAVDDSNVEPAWRAPHIPSMKLKPAKRHKNRLLPHFPEPERTPSPDNAPSIWAGTGGTVGRGRRLRYTAEDDELLLDFVAKARRQGLSLSSANTWKQLEEMSPRHKWDSWKKHYKNKYTYLSSMNAYSEVSASEESANVQVHDRDKSTRGSEHSRPQTAPLGSYPQRPTRIRNPAQRDPNILSWTQAVATIESVDPLLHSTLLQDVKRAEYGAAFRPKHPIYMATVPKQTLRHNKVGQSSTQRASTQHDSSIDNFDNNTEDELVRNSSRSEPSPPPESAACPHADCRLYPSVIYRLGRFEYEDLSPMCLHLLRLHHTTPFPCGEFNCPRKGDSGFFMQADLVRHVKEDHPYATALQRLRGRVDAVLLNEKHDSSRPNPSVENHRTSTPGDRHRDSDFLSPCRKNQETARSRTQRPLSIHGHGAMSSARNDFQLPRQRKSGDFSSLQDRPASATPRQTPSNTSHQKDDDSDIEILDYNPFSNNSIEGVLTASSANESVIPEQISTYVEVGSVESSEKHSSPQYNITVNKSNPKVSFLELKEVTGPVQMAPTPTNTSLDTIQLQHHPITIPNSQSSSTGIPSSSPLLASQSVAAPVPHASQQSIIHNSQSCSSSIRQAGFAHTPQPQDPARSHAIISPPVTASPPMLPSSGRRGILVVNAGLDSQSQRTTAHPKPANFTRKTVDASYEFSDDEDSPPAAKPSFQILREAETDNSPSVTQTQPIPRQSERLAAHARTTLPSDGRFDTTSELKAPPVETSKSTQNAVLPPAPISQINGVNAMLSMAKSLTGPNEAIVETPKAATKVVPSPNTDLPQNDSVPTAKPSFITPLPQKAKPMKSNAHKVAASDDLDELSLGPDDFVFLSSRPRSRAKLEQARVKVEKTVPRGSSILPIRKRKFISLDDDAFDELGEQPGPIVSRSGQIPSPLTQAKDEVDSLVLLIRPASVDLDASSGLARHASVDLDAVPWPHSSSSHAKLFPWLHLPSTLVKEEVDTSDIRLEKEREGEVPIYDSCDDIRRKIRGYLQESGMTAANFVKEIQKTFTNGRKLSTSSLYDFLGQKGASGNQSSIFYSAYIFFEKRRLKLGEEESSHRLEVKRLHPGGIDVKINHAIYVPPPSSKSSSSRQSRTAGRHKTIVGQAEVQNSSSPLQNILTHGKRTRCHTVVKEEEDDGGVKTPGGTLRRCGVDGFTCDRPFCFKCGSATV